MQLSSYGRGLSQLKARRQLGRAVDQLTSSAQKLSTGYRVNRAADDVARISSAGRLQRHAQGLAAATRNLNDVISMLQTAEGGMESAHEILSRMNELAVQASNSNIPSSNRATLIQEFEGLKDSLDSLSKVTEYNGNKVLDGSMCIDFQVAEGSTIDDRYHFSLTQSFESRQFPIPPGNAEATLENFINEAGDTTTFNLMGIPVSFETHGTPPTNRPMQTASRPRLRPLPVSSPTRV